MNVNGNDDMYKAMSVSKVRKVVVRVAGSSKLTIIWPEKYSPEVLRMGLAVTELFRYLPQVSRGRVLELQCHGECPKMHRIPLFVSCAYIGEVGSPVQSSGPNPMDLHNLMVGSVPWVIVGECTVGKE